MENKIKDIYNISFSIEDIRCPMDDWYSSLIHKAYSQINIFDVTRMLIQKMFLELAVTKAIEFIKQNPFCGQRYEGELMELLYGVDLIYLKSHRDDIQKILSKASNENKTYEWLCVEERKEFSELIHSFIMKLE